MFIKRKLSEKLKTLAQQFSVIAIMGPRQSGKTTLAKEVFNDYAYVTMEDLDTKVAAKEDPRGFLMSFYGKKGVIIDEIQEVHELFSYMQGIVDKEYRPGHFIITGSQNFLLHEKITQTLAGRIALLTLLPLSVTELNNAKFLPERVDDLFIKGCYPQLYAHTIDINVWFSNYISTYVEKDVRQILQISDVVTFQRFLKLCAARVGNLLNYSQIAEACEISGVTVKKWISILEASYIIKLVSPYYKNFNKRVIKSPKIYFYDSALVCALLGIKTVDELAMHPMRGALFESFVISEIFKYYYNRSETPQVFFWRDVQGHEIDCVIERSLDHVIPIEIKAGMTVKNEFFKGFLDWENITKKTNTHYVVYGGNENIQRKQAHIFSWRNIDEMMHVLISNHRP